MNFTPFALSFILVALVVVLPTPTSARTIVKRSSFSSLGCLGVYNKSSFLQLEGVCYDCAQLYRQPEVESLCRKRCFVNNVFDGCLEALAISGDERKQHQEMAIQLYGKRR